MKNLMYLVTACVIGMQYAADKSPQQRLDALEAATLKKLDHDKTVALKEFEKAREAMNDCYGRISGFELGYKTLGNPLDQQDKDKLLAYKLEQHTKANQIVLDLEKEIKK